MGNVMKQKNDESPLIVFFVVIQGWLVVLEKTHSVESSYSANFFQFLFVNDFDFSAINSNELF